MAVRLTSNAGMLLLAIYLILVGLSGLVALPIPPVVHAVLALLAIGFGADRLARSFPHVGCLQAFRWPTVQLSEAERRTRRRAANREAGMEIIVAGLVLPL